MKWMFGLELAAVQDLERRDNSIFITQYGGDEVRALGSLTLAGCASVELAGSSGEDVELDSWGVGMKFTKSAIYSMTFPCIFCKIIRILNFKKVINKLRKKI